MKLLLWFCMRPIAPRTPVDNTGDTILVEPNARGGWSLRFEGEPLEAQMGNHPTATDAERIARLNCTHVRVLHPVSQTNTQLETA